MDQNLLHHATLVLPDRICHGGMIWQNDILTEIFEDASQALSSKLQTLKNTTEWDMDGDLIIPGLIDTHIHGAGGCDVMDGTVVGLETLAEALLKEGTTAFLPTTMSCTAEQLKKVLHSIKEFQTGHYRGAKSLGIHLEGPFLAEKYPGAQTPKMIWNETKDGSTQFLIDLLSCFPDLIKILTFAPERPDGREIAAICLAHGVISSAGHTGANYTQMEQAAQWGVRHITHAFNAMPIIHHRSPGLLTKGLLDDEITMEIIADGVHIDPAVIELALRNKPPEKVCLISDGTRAVGMPDGEYELGGQKITVHQGRAQMPGGTIAGSAYPLLQGLKLLVQKLHRPLPEAVRYVTLNPAKLLGIDTRLGSLEPNKEATFIRLSSEFEIKQVWLQGKLVYSVIPSPR